jgi:oligopeptidase B
MSQPTPPIAKTVPFTFTHLGRTFSDPYAWLQNPEDPEVLAYLEAENAYLKSVMAHTDALQETLFQEMKGRIPEDDDSVPERRGEYYYYTRNAAGKQYRIFCRKHVMDGSEEVILDENELAQGHSYCRVFVFQPSPDQRFLAYTVDFEGSLTLNLFIKDLASGQPAIPAPLKNVARVAWANDNRTIFYTTYDASHRTYRLMRHTLGSDPAQDVLVFQEADELFRLLVRRSRSGEYILLTVGSFSSSEGYVLPADQPYSDLRLVEKRRAGIEYSLEHHGDNFLICTNEDAENFRLMAAPVDAPQRANWHEVIPHRSDTLLEMVYPFRQHLVLLERHAGLPTIRISAPDGVSQVRYAAFPEPVYNFTPTDNLEFDAAELRFNYSSLVTPLTTVDYGLEGGEWIARKQQIIPSGYDASQYASERLHAPAPDGALVPISLVYRKDTPRDGSAPLLLEAYGANGFSSDPNFNARRLSLLDRGFIYAIAHVRGGSELGRAWYEQGRLMHKKNTFTDFIACAEHLIRQGYTISERLTATGDSGGGLLMGAVANLRPDLFRAIAAIVPFCNIITAMLDASLPLTVAEYEQWGNPADPVAFDYMLSYSPYDNVTAQAYPWLYIKCGLHDLQVPYWDPAKWAARLRAMKTDHNPLVLYTVMEGGHGGASGRYTILYEMARMYAFLLDAVGKA